MKLRGCDGGRQRFWWKGDCNLSDPRRKLKAVVNPLEGKAFAIQTLLAVPTTQTDLLLPSFLTPCPSFYSVLPSRVSVPINGKSGGILEGQSALKKARKYNGGHRVTVHAY